MQPDVEYNVVGKLPCHNAKKLLEIDEIVNWNYDFKL